MDNLRGSYKIGADLLYRLIGKTLSCGLPGASKYEILSVVYFSQIADASGFIEQFRTLDLCGIIGCSRREAFYLMDSLERKGYITRRQTEFHGYYDITLVGNDFSKYDGNKRYLNTNRVFFNHNSEYSKLFSNLSLYAMRLGIYLLYSYNDDYGYHSSIDNLTLILGIKDRGVVANALKELSLVFGGTSYYSVIEDLKRHRRYGYLDIHKRQILFRPQQGIGSEQPSYFKRHMLLRFRSIETGFYEIAGEVDSHLSELFAIASRALEKGLSIEQIENLFIEQVKKEGTLDYWTMFHIREQVKI